MERSKMAIFKRVRIITHAIADGVSSSFTLNLGTEPFLIDPTIASGINGLPQNWGGPIVTPANAPPSGVAVVEGASSASISLPPGPILTINVPVQPVGYIYRIILDLLF
jgi:hypothetical protein